MAKLLRIAPEIPVPDLGRAIEYYEQKLGFRVVTEMPAADYDMNRSVKDWAVEFPADAIRIL